MSTIYWKFKNTKSEFSSITFDSTHVSILDLKRAIIKQKKLQQTPQQPFDLSIINAHTGVEYTDETGPIPRNLAVIVRRLPAARNQHKKLWAPLQNNSIIATADNISKKQIQTISERLNQEFGPALFNDSNHSSSHNVQSINAEVNAVESETMNIIDMMNRRMNNGTSTTTTSVSMRGPSNNNRMSRNNHHHNNNNNGSGGNSKDGKQPYRATRGDPPPGYICHRCHVSGHWIQDCPTNGDPKYDKKNRPNMGRSQLPVPKPATPTNISGDTTTTNVPTQQVIVGRKCYQIPTNVYESFNGDHSKIKAFIALQSTDSTSFTQTNPSQESNKHSKYKCELCKNYLVDARWTPCCRVTYCNECIRQKAHPSNPSMIKCPSCEDFFSCEALDASKNTKLQEKVDKIVAKLPKENASNTIPIDTSSAITLNPTNNNTNNNNNNNTSISSNKSILNNSSNTNTTKTIQIPHPNTSMSTNTIHIPQPVMVNTKIRPTVILQQSPPQIPTQRLIATGVPPPIAVQPQVPQAIDTTRFEPPKATFNTGDNMNYVCIECGQRGHKYKDCPKVAESIQKQKENGQQQQQQQQQTKIIHTTTATAATGEDEMGGGSASSSSDNESQIDGITNSTDITMNTKSGHPKLKDLEPLDRIPKKTVAEMTGNPAPTSTATTNVKPVMNTNLNKNITFNPNNLNPAQQRLINTAPHVQLINSPSALSTLNAINSVNVMNMRNRLAVNNILMNAALHNVTRRAGGIAPRLINSHNNPLLNTLALSRLPNTTNPTLALLQQQSLLTQQAALNRLRQTNPLLANTINNNINLSTNNINIPIHPSNPSIIQNTSNPSNNNNNNNTSNLIKNNNISSINNNNNNNNVNHNANNNNNNNINNIPQQLLDSTISELKQVMTSSSSDPSAVTTAINNAFIKLGANDPDSKRKVLEQLVATCGGNTNQSNSSNSNPSNPSSSTTMDNNNNSNINNNDISIEKEDDKSSSKKSKKKRSKSKSKRSKKKKKDREHKKSKSSKDRKHRHRRRRDKEDRKERDDKDKDNDRSRSRDRGRSRSRDREQQIINNQQSASSGTDFPDPDDEENNIIHVNIVENNDKKRKLPPAPMPDFAVSPPPPHKKQKTSSNHSIPSPSI